MRKAALILTSLFLISSVAKAEIPWQDDLRSAHAQASAEGKLLLLHFYGDNCVWCDRLEAGAFQTPVVGDAIGSAFVPVKIHVGKNPKMAKMFKVRKWPTDVILTTDGEPLSHQTSPQNPNEYVAMLSTAAGVAGNGPLQTPGGPETQTPATVNIAATDGVATGQTQTPTGPPPTATSGTFVLPSSPAGPTAAQTVGMRTDGMTLALPGQFAGQSTSGQHPAAEEEQNSTPPSASDPVGATAKAAAGTELAMEGYCAVSIIRENAWVEGHPKHGVIHLGKLYLFASAENMAEFLRDPNPYTPVMNEIDVVRFFEERKIVPGKRDFGMKDPIHNRMFFFADEAAMNHFYNQHQRYTDAAIEVMNQAVQDANPAL